MNGRRPRRADARILNRDAMINIVLYRPQMPANTGNVIRLAANCGAGLHLIGPLSFFLDDQRLRRAGLDYRETVRVRLHTNFAAFMAAVAPPRLLAATSSGSLRPSDFAFADGDYLIFGQEQHGLGPEVYAAVPPAHRLRLPMVPGSRCLNLANAVAITVYEAWRQIGFVGAQPDA